MAELSQSTRAWLEADAARQRAMASPSQENIRRAEEAQTRSNEISRSERSSSFKKESRRDSRSSKRD
jgi:hypothetical protein